MNSRLHDLFKACGLFRAKCIVRIIFAKQVIMAGFNRDILTDITDICPRCQKLKVPVETIHVKNEMEIEKTGMV